MIVSAERGFSERSHLLFHLECFIAYVFWFGPFLEFFHLFSKGTVKMVYLTINKFHLFLKQPRLISYPLHSSKVVHLKL